MSDIFSHVVAPVRGAEDPALARPAASAPEPLARPPRVGFDERVDEVPVLPVDVDPDAALFTFGQTLGEFCPVLTAIHRPVEPAPGPAAVEAPARPLPLVHRREDRVGVGGIHGEIDRARVFVDVENLLPRLTAVAAPEHAPLGIGPPQLADRGYINDVGVARMDEHAGDVLRRLEPHVRPRVPPVRRLVDPVPPR